MTDDKERRLEDLYRARAERDAAVLRAEKAEAFVAGQLSVTNADHTARLWREAAHERLSELDKARDQVRQLREACSLSLRALNSHLAFAAATTRYTRRSALQDQEAVAAIEALGIPAADGWDYEEADRRISQALTATEQAERIVALTRKAPPDPPGMDPDYEAFSELEPAEPCPDCGSISGRCVTDTEPR